MTHDDIVAVIQAHKDGKQIECRRKPREWRIGVRKDGSICAANDAWEAVTVREVIEQGGD